MKMNGSDLIVSFSFEMLFALNSARYRHTFNTIFMGGLSMYFAKKYTKCSLAMIGKECGNKDHSTVSYAIRTIGDLIEKDKQVRALVSEIEKNIC